MMNWTIEEEAVFAEIQRVSRLSRIQSIHLWKRYRRDGNKAVAVAKSQYQRPTQAQLASLQAATAARMAIARARKAIARANKASG